MQETQVPSLGWIAWKQFHCGMWDLSSWTGDRTPVP